MMRAVVGGEKAAAAAAAAAVRHAFARLHLHLHYGVRSTLRRL